MDHIGMGTLNFEKWLESIGVMPEELNQVDANNMLDLYNHIIDEGEVH